MSKLTTHSLVQTHIAMAQEFQVHATPRWPFMYGYGVSGLVTDYLYYSPRTGFGSGQMLNYGSTTGDGRGGWGDL